MGSLIRYCKNSFLKFLNQFKLLPAICELQSLCYMPTLAISGPFSHLNEFAPAFHSVFHFSLPSEYLFMWVNYVGTFFYEASTCIVGPFSTFIWTVSLLLKHVSSKCIIDTLTFCSAQPSVFQFYALPVLIKQMTSMIRLSVPLHCFLVSHLIFRSLFYIFIFILNNFFII
jgi:hypothetical protein